MPVTQFWNHFGVTNRENPLFWCANAYAPTGVHTGTYTHKIRLTITVSSQLQYEKCIARRGIDIYLYSNLYININCVYMIWLRWFMIRHIPDARSSTLFLSVGDAHISINAVHSSSRNVFSSTFFHHRSTAPDDPNDELTKFSTFIYYPFQRSHMCVSNLSLPHSDWGFNQIAYTAIDSKITSKTAYSVIETTLDNII